MHKLMILLSGAALAASLIATAQAADVAVSDPYARAVPPGQANSAAFMKLTNTASEDRAVVGADSDVADVVELHTHLMEDGMMRMRRVEEIGVPAGESVSLQPGGLHVMLIGLKKDLAEGDEVALTLLLDNGEKLAVTAPVRKIDMSQMKHH